MICKPSPYLSLLGSSIYLLVMTANVTVATDTKTWFGNWYQNLVLVVHWLLAKVVQTHKSQSCKERFSCEKLMSAELHSSGSSTLGYFNTLRSRVLFLNAYKLESGQNLNFSLVKYMKTSLRRLACSLATQQKNTAVLPTTPSLHNRNCIMVCYFQRKLEYFIHLTIQKVNQSFSS